MYQLNDVIVYGIQGIYRVDDIVEMKLGKQGNKKQYYVLKEMFQAGNKIYAPIDIETVQMRKIIDKDAATKLIEEMPTIELIKAKDDKALHQVYQTLLATTEPKSWISILKSIYRKDILRKEKGIKQLAQSDHQLKKATESLLYSELSISLDIPKEEVEEFIISRIDETVH